jgi:hypothetical protein
MRPLLSRPVSRIDRDNLTTRVMRANGRLQSDLPNSTAATNV